MMFSSDALLNVRLCFYSLAFIHLVVAAILIFSIDLSGDDDPRVRAYVVIRWRLITCWFNLISLAYMPLCLYCDWKEKRRQADQERVAFARKIRDLIMTGILFPIVMHADLFFWRLWNNDPGLIAPVQVFKYLPSWAQHSLHTVSMIVILLDLLLVPRQRPHSLKPGVALMSGFFATYTLVLFWSHWNNAPVYAIIEIFDRYKLTLLVVYSYTECLFYYMTQWCIIDLLWGRPKTLKETQ